MVGPNYVPPRAPEADAWSEPLRGALSDAAADREALASWWQLLDDPLLNDLVARAIAGNPDLAVARRRVREARAQRTAAQAGLYPTLQGAVTLSPIEPKHPRNRQATGVRALWPFDVFGGLRRAVEAAVADLGASEEDLRDALVALEAGVVQSYVDLRAAQVRLAIAEQNLAAQTETARIASWRAQAGLTTVLDTEQARTALEQTRAQLPTLRAGIESAKNHLAILVGERPGSLDEVLGPPGPIPMPPERIALGVPAAMLERRPDVRRAERQLAAETARVGVAKAAAYPSFRFVGAIGTEALSPAGGASLGAAAATEIAQVIFDHGAIHARVKAQKAVRGQSLKRLRATALGALEQVEDGIAAFSADEDRCHGLAQATDSAERAARLSRDQYKSGLADFQVVLDAERSLYSLQDQLAASRQQAATDLVRLYQALGGGWPSEASA